MQYQLDVETDLGKLSNIFKATWLVMTHWGALSVLRSSSECKLTSHMHSIKPSPLPSEGVFAESRAWDCFLHSQEPRRPGGSECVCRRAMDPTARQIQERTFQLFGSFSDPMPLPMLFLLPKMPLFSSQNLLFVSLEHPVLIRLIALSFSTCSTCHF